MNFLHIGTLLLFVFIAVKITLTSVLYKVL